jgi:integrase
VKAEARAAQLKIMTFKEVALDFLQTDKIQTFKSNKHRKQWRSTLEVAFKGIGNLPMQSIDTGIILEMLKPIWKRTPETCTRLRGRIEQIFNYAISLNRFEGLNPARRELFDAHFTGRVRGHHKSMPYADLPAFMGRLRERESVSARALEFAILTVSRTSEAIGARWKRST